MRLLNTSFLKCLIVTAALFTSPLQIRAANSATASGQSTDSSWPREKYSNGTKLIIYQPQVDDWKNFQDLSWRMASVAYAQEWQDGAGRGGNEGEYEHRQRRQGRRPSPIRRLQARIFLHSITPRRKRWISCSKHLFRQPSQSPCIV